MVWVVFGVVALVLGISWAVYRIKERRWVAFGQAAGYVVAKEKVAPTQDGPSLRGTYLGRDVVLYRFHTGFGRNRRDYTAAELRLRTDAPGADLHISRDGMGAWLAKRFGGQDILVGDDVLDGRFRFQASDEDLARRILETPTLRSRLMAADRFDSLRVEGDRVTHVTTRHRLDPTRVESALLLLATLGDAVDTLGDAVEREAPPPGPTASRPA